MKKIVIYYGAKNGYEEIIPTNIKTLTELVTEHDNRSKTFTFDKDNKTAVEVQKEKEYIENLVAYSESYAGITEGAVQSFISLLSNFEIDNLYLQNPPIQIKQQFEQAFPSIIETEKYEYKTLTKEMFCEVNNTFSDKIIGQDKVKEKILVSLYPLLKNRKNKPVVIMFYGPSGVGKTQTAKFISNVLGQKIFRKQLSMYQNVEFSNYLFGGNHFQNCFAKDLLERESNVILLDEFDKPPSIFHSAFYQLFDEGIFEDKNYNVELHNSIIICTSNYNSEEEIRKHLGDPIYYRFDMFVKFDSLTIEALKKVIDLLVEAKINNLEAEERKILNIEEIKQILHSNVTKFKNVRHIDNIIEELIGIKLVENFFNNSDGVLTE